MNHASTSNDVLPERMQPLNIDHNFQSYTAIDAPDVGATRADGPSVPPS